MCEAHSFNSGLGSYFNIWQSQGVWVGDESQISQKRAYRYVVVLLLRVKGVRDIH